MPDVDGKGYPWYSSYVKRVPLPKVNPQGLRVLMDREGKTARQLAEHLGVNVSTVKRWLNGSRHLPKDPELIKNTLLFFDGEVERGLAGYIEGLIRERNESRQHSEAEKNAKQFAKDTELSVGW